MCLGRALGLTAGALAFIAIYEALDPPATYTCTGEPPPEVADLRADFMPPAFVFAALFGAALAVLAWRWAALRSEGRGLPRRPGRLALGAAIVAVPVWALIVGTALTSERVGGPFLFGFLLAVPGAAILAVLGLLLVVQLFLVLPSSPNWAERAESLTVAGAWTLLVLVYPFSLVAIAVVGKDATIMC